MTTTRGPDIVNGLITNWVPLTTPGPTNVNECSSAVYFLPGGGSTLIAFDPYYGTWIDPGVKCLATQHSQWWQQHSNGVTTDINLGPFACPTGFTTATASRMNDLTTFIGCCPSAYKYQGTLLPAATLGQCLSPLSTGQVVTAKSTSGGFTWYATTTTVDTAQDMIGVHINGFVFRDAAELSSPASTSASTTSSSTVSTSSSLTATGTPAASGNAATTGNYPPSGTSSVPNGPSGLGSGAKIGIGIGVSLTTIGVLCLLATGFLLRRRARVKPYDPGANKFVEAPAWNPYDSRAGNAAVPFVEAPTETVMDKKRGPVEMWVSSSEGG